jgi:hypothetical protein
MTHERFNHNWTDYARSIGYSSERDMLEDMYLKQGLSLSQICVRIGCGLHTVNRHLNDLGISKRSRGGCNGSANQSRKLFLLDQRVVMKHNLYRLARLIGVSSSLLYKYRRTMQRQKEDDTWNSVSSAPSQVSNATQP